MTSMNVGKEILTLTVDRDRSIADGVTAGKYDWSDLRIKYKKFPLTEKGLDVVKISFVHFDESAHTDQVFEELDKRDLRPADLQELLAIGEQYPDRQGQFPIVALGSILQSPLGPRCAPCLFANDVGRLLCLISEWSVDGFWHTSYRFAAVRK